MTTTANDPALALSEDQKKALEPIIRSKVAAEVESAVAEAKATMRDALRAEVEAEVREEFEGKFEKSRQELAELTENFVERRMAEMVAGADAETQDLVASSAALKAEKAAIAEKYEADKKAAEAKLAAVIERLQKFVEKGMAGITARHAETEEAKLARIAEVNAFAEKEIGKETSALAEDRDAFVRNVKRANDFVIKQLGKKLAEMDGKNEQVDIELERLKGESRRRINELAAEYARRDADKSRQLAEAVHRIKSFVERQLGREISELREHAKGFEAAKAQLRADYARIVEFVERRMKVEIDEMRADNKALVDQRVKLLAESEAKLEEAKQQWIAEQTERLQKFVETRYAAEMAEMKADIKEARLNRFGRKIAEAFIVEARESGFLNAEGSEIAQLESQVAEANAERNQARSVARAEAKKAEIAEAGQRRMAVLDELTRALPKGQRDLMEKLLESTPTADLKKVFEKHIGSVMSERPAGSKNAPRASKPQALTERGGTGTHNAPARRTRVIETRNGNRRSALNEGGGNPAPGGNPDAVDPIGAEVLNLSERLSKKFATKKRNVPA